MFPKSVVISEQECIATNYWLYHLLNHHGNKLVSGCTTTVLSTHSDASDAKGQTVLVLGYGVLQLNNFMHTTLLNLSKVQVLQQQLETRARLANC